MATFTTESLVREKFQWTDSNLVPSSLITASMDDAHAELLRFLDPEFDTPTPEDRLVMGETLLAGAHVLRSLASKDVFDQRRITIGGQGVEEGLRFKGLLELAATVEKQAWDLLEPYLLDEPQQDVAKTTDTVPVLGEE